MFCEHVLQQDLVEQQVGHQPFQLRGLLLQRLELPDLFGFKPRIPPLPPIDGLLDDVEMTVPFDDGRPRLGLLPYAADLFYTEAFPFHSILLPTPSRGLIMPETLSQNGLKTSRPATFRVSHIHAGAIKECR